MQRCLMNEKGAPSRYSTVQYVLEGAERVRNQNNVSFLSDSLSNSTFREYLC